MTAPPRSRLGNHAVGMLQTSVVLRSEAELWCWAPKAMAAQPTVRLCL